MLRLLWCKKHRNTDFSKHIFTDETMIRLWDLPLYHCRLPSSYPEAIPCTTKYRKKINICGGISFEGPTPFKVIKIINFVFLHFKKSIVIYKVFEQNMDASLYRDILVFDFFPFMAAKFDFDCILHQDNDGKHTSKLCKSILNDNNIKWV
jgi:hypothetical protein